MQARGRGRGRGRGGAVIVAPAPPPLPRVGLARATEAMLRAHPRLALFRGLNELGTYNDEFSSYTTFGNMGSSQKERMKTYFALTSQGRAICTVLVSDSPKGIGAPFKLCGKEIAIGDGGSNMARHMESHHPEHLPPEDAIAKGLHPITRVPEVPARDGAEAAPDAAAPAAQVRDRTGH